MSNGQDAPRVLLEECASAVKQIQGTHGMKTCAGHDPLSLGVVVLLRCEGVRQERAVEGSTVRRRLGMWFIERAIAVLFAAAVLGVGVAIGHTGVVQTLVKVAF